MSAVKVELQSAAIETAAVGEAMAGLRLSDVQYASGMLEDWTFIAPAAMR